ncbi:radical SAM protein [bacterium]|nr:radical SAM protein [bacterium]
MARYGETENTRTSLLDAERGTLVRKDRAALNVGLVALSPYDVAMASLGFQTIYRLFNAHPEVRCERVFCLDRDNPAAERSWLALESGAPPSTFDVLALSLSYEQDCLWLPLFLRAMGLPTRAQARWGNLPVLLAGGPVPSGNPEPVAPFVEALGLGDGEVLVPDFIDTWLESARRTWERGAFLEALAARPGFYIPSLYRAEMLAGEGGVLVPRPAVPAAPERVRRQSAPLTGDPAHSVIITSKAHFSEMFMLELARGCRHACRFCLVSRINRPWRVSDPLRVEALLENAPESAQVAGLVGTNLCDYPELPRVLRAVQKRGLRLGASSLRVDTLNDEILGLLLECGTRSITLAPETASAALLRELGKPSAAELLPSVVARASEMGFEQVKLYYMIGLPGESEADRAALGEQVRELAGSLGPRTRLRISLNPFVPKPQTAWQDEAMLAPRQIKAALNQVRRALSPLRRVELQCEPPAGSLIQALISLGDSRLAAALEAAEPEGRDFLAAAGRAGIDTEAFLHQKKKPSAPRPWDHVE